MEGAKHMRKPRELMLLVHVCLPCTACAFAEELQEMVNGVCTQAVYFTETKCILIWFIRNSKHKRISVRKKVIEMDTTFCSLLSRHGMRLWFIHKLLTIACVSSTD